MKKFIQEVSFVSDEINDFKKPQYIDKKYVQLFFLIGEFMKRFIQEVAFGSDEINSVKKPQYIDGKYINVDFISKVRPTKNDEVFRVVVDGKDSFVFAVDIKDLL